MIRNVTVSMQQRNDTDANWTSKNPILKVGEIGFNTTTNKAKFGNGTARWNSLEYIDNAVLEQLAILQEKIEPSNAGVATQVLTKTASGQEWKEPSGGAIVSTSTPAGKANAIWVNPTTGIVKYWNGTTWANTYGVFS